MDKLEQNIQDSASILKEISRVARQQQAAQWSNIDAQPPPSIQTMRQAVWVNTHWDIAWPHWPPGIKDKVVAVWQKISRRLLQWYIEPIIQQQNEFNQATLLAVELLALEVSDLNRLATTDSTLQHVQLDRLVAQIESLQTTLAQEKRP